MKIDQAKKYMRTNFPDIKNSHRIEGMARVFGYKTYAAMLSDLGNDGDIDINNADWNKLSEYLSMIEIRRA